MSGASFPLNSDHRHGVQIERIPDRQNGKDYDGPDGP